MVSFSQAKRKQTLLSVFKGRASGRDKDTAVERCEVELREGIDETECRLVIRMICGLGKQDLPVQGFYVVQDL